MSDFSVDNPLHPLSEPLETLNDLTADLTASAATEDRTTSRPEDGESMDEGWNGEDPFSGKASDQTTRSDP